VDDECVCEFVRLHEQALPLNGSFLVKLKLTRPTDSHGEKHHRVYF